MPTLIIIITAVSGWLTSAFGWFKWLHELREKRLERTEKEKAQAELALIRRRALTDNPYFTVGSLLYNSISFPTEKPTEWAFVHPFSTCVLSAMSVEVKSDVQPGSIVYLIIENKGNDATDIKVDLDGNPAALVNGEWDGRNPVLTIGYAYHPENHGKEQTFRISFLAANGVRDTHLYKTRHGMRMLKRVDPN